MHVPLSIIIKTFERPNSLKNLLKSVRNLGVNYPILIADDSRESSETFIRSLFSDLPITYLNLPFDTGLSEGRNVLLNNVTTPYFVLCDDDYVFESRTDFVRAYNHLIHNNLDIVGGDYYNYVNIPSLKVFFRQLLHPFRLKRFFLNQYTTDSYIGNFNIKEGGCELLVTSKPPNVSPVLCDLVNNFFIAKTDSIKKMGGWDKALKMGEHEDFFLRSKQSGLKVAYLPKFGTGHYPAIPVKNSAYNQYRVRASFYKNLFVKKHGFNYYIEKQIDTGKILFKANIEDLASNK